MRQDTLLLLSSGGLALPPFSPLPFTFSPGARPIISGLHGCGGWLGLVLYIGPGWGCGGGPRRGVWGGAVWVAVMGGHDPADVCPSVSATSHGGLFHSFRVHSVGTSPLSYGLALRRRRKAFAVEFGSVPKLGGPE
eukprot:scaffold5040_cov95-Isochrysis_galbana.AAC.2